MHIFHQLRFHKLKIRELEILKSKDPNDASFYDKIIAEEKECIRLLRN